MMLDNIKTPQELYDFIISNITYGFVNNKKVSYVREKGVNDSEYENELFNNYYLQSPEELLKSKCGICFDQVELSRIWFISHGYEILTFYTSFHNHVILVYKDNDRYYLFETSLKFNLGIHEYNSLEECLNDYYKVQMKNTDKKVNEFIVYKYDKLPYGKDINYLFDYIKKDNNKIVM